MQFNKRIFKINYLMIIKINYLMIIKINYLMIKFYNSKNNKMMKF